MSAKASFAKFDWDRWTRSDTYKTLRPHDRCWAICLFLWQSSHGPIPDNGALLASIVQSEDSRCSKDVRRVLKACGFDFDGMLWTNPIAMSYFHDATKRSGTARRGGTEGEVEGEKDTAVVVVREGVAVPDDSTSKNSSKGAFPLTLPGIEPPPKDSRAKRVAMVYLTTFNTIFGRKVGNPTLVANLVDRIEKRMRQGIEAELIFLAPILAKAAGWQYVDGDPTVLLRDGTHGKTAATGQTTGATDHMTKLAGHLDTITLTGRLASAARAIPGAEAWLKDRGVRFEEPGAGA